MADELNVEYGNASLFQRLAIPLGVDHCCIVAAWQDAPDNWTVIFDRDPQAFRTNQPAWKARLYRRPSGEYALLGEPWALTDFWSELAGKLRHVARAFPWDQTSSS